MKINTIQNTLNFEGTILIPFFEINTESTKIISIQGVEFSTKLFSGKKDTHYIRENKNQCLIFVGIGKDIPYKSLVTIFRRISSKQKELLQVQTAVVIPIEFSNFQVEALLSGLKLGTYNLGHFKTKKQDHPFLSNHFQLSLVTNKDLIGVSERGLKIANSQLETFHLVDLPPNVVTPKYMANWAITAGEKFGFDVEILGFEASKKAGLEAFLAVGKGSENEPQFVIMTYKPKVQRKKLKHIGLVGKGITFDTGGLNIKTAGMVHMKCDMAGGAAVMGAMQLIADLQLSVQVTAIVPCAENSVDSKSFAPSDVIQSYSGNSIEIIDTDAEGRLVLADGLSYLIKNFDPEYLIDIATLTGSSVGTFGYECGALFTNNDSVSASFQEVGSQIGEKLWPLPLWDNYKSDIESEIADVKNYSGKPVAGAISAAKFLEFFTNDHQAWAHLDIAGVAFGDDEFAKTKHATAYGVHLLTKFIETL